MITVKEARKILTGACPAPRTEEVALEEARGRVLAERIRADRDFPAGERSAMDGYAVRAKDVPEPGCALRVVGEVPAGASGRDVRVGPGEAARVFTGAVVPEGADAVVMVEWTEEADGGSRVILRRCPEPGRHIRHRGEDVRRNEVVLEPGIEIRAPEIAVLAAVGKTRVRVYRRPRVGVLSTGSEVVEPDRPVLDHQIRNSNARALVAQVAELGIRARYLGIARDTEAELDRALHGGSGDLDLLLITGGVSAGRYDLVRPALERAGAEILFHGIAVKPGKPVLAARLGRGLVVGLPGNPVSTFTAFAVFVAPVVRRMMGAGTCEPAMVSAVLTAPLPQRPGREGYHLARVEFRDGAFRCRRVRTTGSGDVVSLSRANAFAVTEAGSEVLQPGREVPVVLWSDFHLR